MERITLDETHGRPVKAVSCAAEPDGGVSIDLKPTITFGGRSASDAAGGDARNDVATGAIRKSHWIYRLYAETARLVRQAAPDAIRRLIELMGSEDERVAAAAFKALLERAFGRPKEYDPSQDKPPSEFNLRDYTSEELVQIEAVLLIKSRQAERPVAIEPPEK